MGRKSFGEIVRQSVGIAAFVGIGIVMAGNITGNREWYHGSYGMKQMRELHVQSF